jgi:hypothetical protein
MRGRGDLSRKRPLPFVHYSETPMAALGSVSQLRPSDVGPLGANYLRKPRGLWFAEDGQWQNSAGGWQGPQAFRHRYEVTFLPELDLIRLETPEQFHDFADLFAETHDYRDCDFIRWHEVAMLADGIQVAVDVYQAIKVGRTGWLWDGTSHRDASGTSRISR